MLAGADVGADQRHQRPAETERERDQQIFEPGADAISRDRRRPERSDQTGRERDRQVGHQRDQRGDGADPQDVPKQRPAQRGLEQFRMHHAAARPEVIGEGERAEAVVEEERCGAPRHLEPRERPPAENQAG